MAGARLSMSVAGSIVVLFVVFLCSGFSSPLSRLRIWRLIWVYTVCSVYLSEYLEKIRISLRCNFIWWSPICISWINVRPLVLTPELNKSQRQKMYLPTCAPSENSDQAAAEVIKLFSCSTQLSTKFSPLINMKMPTTVGIFIFISRENFMLS